MMRHRRPSTFLTFAILAGLAWGATQLSPNVLGASVLMPLLCAPGLLALLVLTGGNVHDSAGLGATAATVVIVVVSAGTYTLVALGICHLARTPAE